MIWSTALPEWERRILSGQSLVPCGPLFPNEAHAALEVFCGLRIVDAAGQPTFAETGDQWVLDFVAVIFGAYDAETAKRLINEFFLCVAKKNGKSTIAAGIMLTALIRNWRNSNELIIVAPTIKAADNSFKPAADMVRADPDLLDFLHVQDHLRQITHLKTKATLRVLAADTGTVAGNKAAFVLIDELWEFGSRPRADAMMREAAGGLVARPEGFLISITTQSDQQPAGIFRAKLNYARDVRDGRIIDPKFLPVIYEFPKRMIDDGSFLEPANFYISNPYLGRTDWGREWIAAELEKENAKGPDTRNVFLSKHLNIEIGINYRADRWAGSEYWDSRADPSITLDTLLDRSEVVVVGGDGGGLDDLLGLSVLGRCRETKHWLSWSHAWAHRSVLERRKSIASVLTDFERAGELTIVAGNELADRYHRAVRAAQANARAAGAREWSDADKAAVAELRQEIVASGSFPDDIRQLAAIIERVKGLGLLAEVGVDPAGLGLIVDALALIGVTEENKLLVGVGQGYRLMSAIKTSERRLENGTFWHADQTLMDWCVGNVKIEPTATAIRATKQNAGDAKIDPWCALMNACDRMSLNPGGVVDIAAMVA